MKIDRRKVSGYLLLVGMMFLTIGLSTKITTFSWVAMVCILISLGIGGRWLKRK